MSKQPLMLIFSLRVSQTGLFEGVPGSRATGGGFAEAVFFQACEYLLDDRRVFDAGSDFHHPTPLATGFDIDVENTPVKPSQIDPGFGHPRGESGDEV